MTTQYLSQQQTPSRQPGRVFSTTMNQPSRFVSGFIGATALTLLHEGVRRVLPSAPRLDVLGMRGVEKIMQAFHFVPLSDRRLRLVALLGDLIANTVYYSRVPSTRNTSWQRALVLGSAAGIATQVLAPKLGLGRHPVARRKSTRVMTVAWYLAGALVSAWAAQRWNRHEASARQQQ